MNYHITLRDRVVNEERIVRALAQDMSDNMRVSAQYPMSAPNAVEQALVVIACKIVTREKEKALYAAPSLPDDGQPLPPT